MAENHLTITVDNRPVRGKGGTSVSTNLRSRINSPATPTRSKKRLRFSEPRPETEFESASSGLTPLICRTTLSSTTPPAGHRIPAATLWNRGGYGILNSGIIQFEPLRQVLPSRVKRRLRRRRLSEETNKIEWEDRLAVKRLRTEVERLRSELEAKCAEMQSIRDMEDLAGQEGSGDSIATNMELTTRVQELEQQLADLKAELQQKEVESEDFEDVASRDLLNLNEDDGRVITNGDLQETHINDDMIGISTELDTSFPSPPPTMPNTPCKHSPSVNARVPASITSPDSANEALNNQLQSESELRRELGLANYTPKTAQPPTARPRKEKVRPRKGKVDMENYAVRGRDRRQATGWTSQTILVPFSGSGD
ncbi:hypothetical protein BDZ45DRAFT_798975 [Acephala macrosclerotiorum]|nr:hypothetical protein BDZ45DRAFT_798975 [Acephala macrosclerotiorum]